MMTDISRRRLLKTAAATALGVSTASRAGSSDAMEEIDFGQPTKPHKCSHGWFIARQDRLFTGAHAVDFWSQPHCNISHADHLPPEIARGVVWFEYPASRQLRDERAIGAVNSFLKESETNWFGWCRFRKLDSCVSMVKPAKNRMRDNVSQPLDRTWAGRVLPERNVSSHFIVIDRIFRKNSPKVLGVENDQMISTLAPDRPDQAFNISVLPGRVE